MNWLVPENELDREQRKFLNEFINRNDNELIIGFPGSGKTMLLYYAALRKSGNKIRMQRSCLLSLPTP